MPGTIMHVSLHVGMEKGRFQVEPPLSEIIRGYYSATAAAPSVMASSMARLPWMAVRCM